MTDDAPLKSAVVLAMERLRQRDEQNTFCLGRLAALALLGLAAAGCWQGGSVEMRRFPLTGVVVGREESPPRLVVAHDPVQGFMPAMTMALEIRGEAPPVRGGDRILATLAVGENRSWLEDVRVTTRGLAHRVRISPAGRALPGALLPDVHLVDQDGNTRPLRDPSGRVLVVTFIYTRCPMPDLCPLMIKHLDAVRRRADQEGLGSRLALLGVTLDPEFDTPDVLSAYGRSVLAEPEPFERWAFATGSPTEIEQVAGFFGVGYRADAGLVMHTLATAVVAHDGRVMRTFASNSWRPEDLFEVVKTGLERAANRPTE